MAPVTELERSSSLLYKDFEQHGVPAIVSATGIYLGTQDGRTILDATSGAAVACLGYGNPDVQKAMVDQMMHLCYCHPGFYKTQVAEDLADFLVATTNGVMSKALLCGSGSEAVEVALKLAKTYFAHLPEPQPERTRFIARAGAWHGATLGALTLGDFRGRKDPFVSLLSQNCSRVSACSTYRGARAGESDNEYAQRLAQELDDEFRRIGPHRVCAFVAETVGGSASGCAVPVPGYFAAVKAVCERHGALLILDEVMCGMGRTGTLHAWEQEGVEPDIQATYMAHPLAAAAALRTQQVVQQQRLVPHVRDVGAYLGRRLRDALLPHPNVGDVRGRGLFWAVELVADKQKKTPFPSKLGVSGRLHARGMSKGYEVALFAANGTCDGYVGDHFLICPPYVVSRQDVDEIVYRVALVVQDTMAEVATQYSLKDI
ncbi:aminotransferase [Apiospora kogelbergensis]|uniref:aminotransferase n=1 Tax=Apiospora kogelbergensis TaxID=1337665 RepID=UPI00313164BF